MPELDCINFLSHGTLESRDLDKTRAFYEQCLGLEVVRTSPRSLMIRLGGDLERWGAGERDKVNPNEYKPREGSRR